MKKFVTSVIVLIFFNFAGMPLTAQNISDLYAKVDSTVVIVEVLSAQTAGTGDLNEKVSTGSLGSGVLINKSGKNITAAHVVNNAEAIRLFSKAGRNYRQRWWLCPVLPMWPCSSVMV